MSGLGLLFQWASTMKIQQSVLFLLTADNLVIISLKLTCPFHDIAEALFLCRYSSINHSLKTRETVLVVIVHDSWKSENITSMYWCLFFSSGIRGFLNQCFKYRFKDWLIVCCWALSGFEPKISRIREEHADHYTIDTV